VSGGAHMCGEYEMEVQSMCLWSCEEPDVWAIMNR
jgi:hypothetical protein